MLTVCLYFLPILGLNSELEEKSLFFILSLVFLEPYFAVNSCFLR